MERNVVAISTVVTSVYHDSHVLSEAIQLYKDSSKLNYCF